MDASQSSKVTVEYHDPSGVFPLISKDLASKLPLRNLNWKSPIRPLRSIAALHVEFVPDAVTAAKSQTPTLQRLDSGGSGTADATSSSVKERRHQIPGLLQTPYLKIYLLRCDDKDAYKATERQLLRDWISDNTNSTQNNNTDKHDACEWLILHVVIPDTVAASEPRWTAASKKDPDELVERPQSTAKWPGKSTRTVLDKIRADFNTSTKSAPDRVAQLRLQKQHVPPQLLPQTPVPSLYVETPQEQDNAWQDLIAKFKTLILMSFDLRVSQYEDDLREKDAQRSLPGWNFCTFFTLKEGLAKGFESVGLVEDALAIYDELSAGLDTAVRDAASQSTFLGDMTALSLALQQILVPSSSTTNTTNQQIQTFLTQPLDLNKKDYRGEIVKNTISLFDFSLYIFARQRTLLLRLAAGLSPTTTATSQSSLAAVKDDSLTFYAEACRRAAVFAATESRALRTALQAGSANENISSSAFPLLVDDVVLSWTYAVLDQVLAETASDKLSAPQGGTDGLSVLPHRSGPGSRKEGGAFHFPQGANTHPTRGASLQRTSSGSSMRPPSQVIYENEKYANSSTQSSSVVSAQAGSGLMSLAAGRAELIMMQRKIVEAVAKRKGWSTGWASLAQSNALFDVDLDGSGEGQDGEHVDGKAVNGEQSQTDKLSPSLLSPALATALTSLRDFRAVYEELTNLALLHFKIAEHHKSSDMIASDLAVLKFQNCDYAQAASLFQKSSQSYLQGHWTYVHAEMLRAYAVCLKELHRKDEYMRVMLSLLSKVIGRQRKRSLPTLNFPVGDSASAWHDDEAVDVSGILATLSDFSQELPYIFTVPLADFFGDIRVSPELVHHDDKDGFALDLHLRHLLEENLTLDRVRLRLVHSRDASQEIWLEAREDVELRRGLMELRLHSDTTTYGVYLIDKLVLDTQKLRFIHEFQPKPQATPLSITSTTNVEQKPFSTGPSVLIFPSDQAFDARATLIEELHVDKLRNIVLHVDTGRNDIKTLDLRLRGASAGLRLHTADAVVLEGSVDLDTSHVGTIRMNAIGPHTKLRISLPYSLEHNLAEVAVKLEAHYTTSAGSFFFVVSCNITVELPLDVDVHDIFKADALFSLFSIRTTKSIPLQLTNVTLQDSAAYAVQALPCPPTMTVFEKQPASLTYRITKKPHQDGNIIDKKEAALAMTVQYISISDEILNTITTVFQAALKTSPHAHLARLLIPYLRNGVQSHEIALQFESAVLLRELRLPNYETMSWNTAVVNLSPATHASLQDWLRAWHAENAIIAFDPTAGQRRAITIAVDVPTIDVVHTASLTLLTPSSSASSSGRTPGIATAILGQPIKAELSIRHTRIWAAETSEARQGPLHFVYTIRDVAETWLVGGQRRGRFSFACPSDISSSDPTTEASISADHVPTDPIILDTDASPTDLSPTTAAADRKPTPETKLFPLTLIPLKPGTHTLPTIDIVPVSAPEQPSQRHSASLWTSVTRVDGGEADALDPRPGSSSSGAGAAIGDGGLGIGRSVSPAAVSPAVAAFGAASGVGVGVSNGGGGGYFGAVPATGVGVGVGVGVGAGVGMATRALPTCETVVASAGTIVRVVRDTRTTSVNIGSGGTLSGDVVIGVAGGGGGGTVGGLAGGVGGVSGSRIAAGRSGSADTRISGFVGS